MTTDPHSSSDPKAEIASRVKKILAEQLDVEVDELQDDKHVVNDFGADSLGVIEIVLAVEEDFELDIPDEDIEKSAGTVASIVEYVRARKEDDA